MRTDVAMPFWIRVFAVSMRLEGGGVFGSNSLAVWSLSVVMVKEAIDGIRLRRSMSLVISVDFVIIWILQFCWVKIWRHFRIKPVSASIFGYGSEELAIETISPLSFAASLRSFGIKSFFGLQT
jgi:hypothetical protein